MHASVFVCPYLCYICLYGRHVCFAFLEVFRLVAISSLSLFLLVRYCLKPFALCSIDLCEFGLLSRKCEFLSISVIDENQL